MTNSLRRGGNLKKCKFHMGLDIPGEMCPASFPHWKIGDNDHLK